MRLKPSAMRHVDELIARYPDLVGLRDCIAQAATLINKSYLGGGKVLVCGNGGSAADSEHIVGELMKGFILRRELLPQDVERLGKVGGGDLAPCLQRGIPAVALTGHPALSSAVLNDNDPFMAFAQQVYALGKAGDVLIGLSTSGNSRNVVNAMKVAKAFGLSTVGLTGSAPCQMDEFGDVSIKVPATETFKVQEYHLPVYHAICMMVEEEIFGK
ncbi:MAG: D-sedoheptulose-7-phosphate isomerase [Armatimonadota bacterium]